MKRSSTKVVSIFIGSLFGAVISIAKNYSPCTKLLFSDEINDSLPKNLSHFDCAKDAFYNSAFGFTEGMVISIATALTYEYLIYYPTISGMHHD